MMYPTIPNLTLPCLNPPSFTLSSFISRSSPRQVADSERLKRAHVRDYVAKRAKLDFSFIGDVPQEPTAGNLVFEPVKLSAKTNVPCHFTGTITLTIFPTLSVITLTTSLLLLFLLVHFASPFISGADSKFVDSAARWVAVPEVLLSDPVFSPLGPFSESTSAAEGSSNQMVVADSSSAAASSSSSSSTAIKTEQGDIALTPFPYPTSFPISPHPTPT